MLSQYEVINPSLTGCLSPRKFINSLKIHGNNVFFFFFQPCFSGFDQDFLKKRTDSTFIFTKNFFERISSPHSEEYDELLLPERANLYVYDGISSLVSLTVTERFMALMLLNKKGKLDQNLLISSESEAIEWGKELFMYYREISKKIYGDKADRLLSEKNYSPGKIRIWDGF